MPGTIWCELALLCGLPESAKRLNPKGSHHKENNLVTLRGDGY